MDDALLGILETYYDAAPRPSARTEEVGPFTLFVQTHADGWPYYARPRLGLDRDVTAHDVEDVLARMAQLDVPRALEWVHQTTPSLLGAARAAAFAVRECPLLVLPADGSISQAFSPRLTHGSKGRVRILAADDPDLPLVSGVVHAGFEDTDTVAPRGSDRLGAMIASGLTVVVAAYDEQGHVVGGGSHSPRGDATELTGIAVLPRARRRGVGAAITRALAADAQARGIHTVFLSAQDDDVARVYESVGFRRVGTACIAELQS